MKQSKKTLSMLLALVLIFTMLPVSALAVDTSDADTNSVDIYLSISDDADYVEAEGMVMAFKKLTVPYFDLAEYGLEQLYFVSETYGKGEGATEDNPSSNLQPGTAEFAYGKVTMLHAIIYATEIFYCNIDPEDAGKGFMADWGLLGSDALTITGSTGSIFITSFWDMDQNFNYYHNYQYPLASPGWGSTADQILLHDGDIITLGHFTSWNFHTDSRSVFNLIKADDDSIVKTVAQGEQIDLSVYVAGKGSDYATAHKLLTNQPAVYYTSSDDVYSVVSQWNYLGDADENGRITVDTTYMEPGEYYICVKGQYGADYPKEIVSTPGGIILNVILPGDANGDGSVNLLDLVRICKYLADDSVAIEKNSADMNGDGEVKLLDLVRLCKQLSSN